MFFVLGVLDSQKSIYFLSIFLWAGKMPSENNQHDTENPSTNKYTFGFGTSQVGFLPPNYATFQQFVMSAYVHNLGLSGAGMYILHANFLIHC